MADSDALFPDLEPAVFPGASPSAPVTMAQPYRVLARKYRPQIFADLIGQEAMVRTLGNAIRRDRVAHAFLLTGVRGVGKTTTARLIAKALNCIGPDGKGGATIDPCGQCEPCMAIAEGRHIDVVEMDAASNTGVDDVREIIEAARYAAVSARYKVYIVDEVHMLSKNAFNALLKTLEEPPAHVKFLFATTEVNKVPVTVLSRCQRFDLRRIEPEQLIAHFTRVCAAENVDAEADAFALIARAAEGSVRDGLSILDQAIAHADDDEGAARPFIAAEQVRTMLGLADRGGVRDLLAAILEGQAQLALTRLQAQRALGVDPSAVLRGLLDQVHALTLAKVGAPPDPALTAEDQALMQNWAGRLGFATLHRLWQLLLKGHDETASAVDPDDAADMVVLRLVHAGTLPDPGELLKRLENAPASTRSMSPGSLPSASLPAPETVAEIPDLPANALALAQWLKRDGRHHLAQQFHDFVGVVRFEPGVITLVRRGPLPEEFPALLRDYLRTATGQTWQITLQDPAQDQIQDQPAHPPVLSLHEQERAAQQRDREAVLAAPLVKACFAAFPDAEVITIARSDPHTEQAA